MAPQSCSGGAPGPAFWPGRHGRLVRCRDQSFSPAMLLGKVLPMAVAGHPDHPPMVACSAAAQPKSKVRENLDTAWPIAQARGRVDEWNEVADVPPLLAFGPRLRPVNGPETADLDFLPHPSPILTGGRTRAGARGKVPPSPPKAPS